jgi:ADP-ribosyl-[dinitrogen reductase] hydrolase
MIESSGFSCDEFANRLTAWGTAWTLDERLNRGVGFTTRASVENMIAGRSWKESGIDIPTCGSAMRAAPVGLLYHCDLDMVSRYADLQSLPTHCGSAARAGAVAVAVAIALGLKGFSKEVVLRTAAQKASSLDAELADRLLWTISLLEMESEQALSAIGTSPLASETVPAAFYCFLKYDPEEALIMAASSGGDTDSIASIAGSLFGALHGASWIPERWLAPLEQKERIEHAAKGLAELNADLCR